MPVKKDPDSLKNFSSTFVSQILWNFVDSHIFKECLYCSSVLSLGIKKCSSALLVEEVLSTIPYDAFSLVQSKVEKISKTETEYLGSRNIFRILNFIYRTCHDNSLVIPTMILLEPEDVSSAKYYGKRVRNVQFISKEIIEEKEDYCSCFPIFNDDEMWLEIFSSVKNVTLIDLDCVTITGTLLQAIGKECVNITYLINVFVCQETIVSGFMKLCYEDPETKSKKNNCCTTLQVIDLERDHTVEMKRRYAKKDLFPKYNYSDRTLSYVALTDIFHILMHNCPNVRFLGVEFYLYDYILRYGNTIDQLEFSLVEMASIYLDKTFLEVIQKSFPKCSTLILQVDTSDDTSIWSGLAQLPQLQELIVLDLNGTIISDYINQHITTQTWTSLKKFSVAIFPLDELDILLFAKAFPNLEVLGDGYILQTYSVIWDYHLYFTKLVKISLDLHEYNSNLDWMTSFSETIEDVLIRTTPLVLLTKEKVNIIAQDTFPNLVSLKIHSLEFDANFINQVFQQCPKLEEIGYFQVNDQQKNLVQEFQSNLAEQNYYLSLLLEE